MKSVNIALLKSVVHTGLWVRVPPSPPYSILFNKMNANKELTVNISATVKIDSDQLYMYNRNKDLVRKYNEIPESELKDWVVSGPESVFRKCNKIVKIEYQIP